MRVSTLAPILLLLIAILTAGCFEIDEIGPDPEDGDLVLTISMDVLTYDVQPDSMVVRIELKNIHFPKRSSSRLALWSHRNRGRC